MTTSAEKIEIAVNYALAQVGKPYSYTANPPNSWDCSKLTAAAWGQAGIKLTPYTKVQVTECVKVPNVSPSNYSNLQRGDLLFFFENESHHVSMYLGNDQIVEASSPENGVRQIGIWYQWNIDNFTTAARPKGIEQISGSSSPSTGNNQGNNNNQKLVTGVRKVERGAVALSNVHGTTQTARFAALNVTNESVYLSASNSNNVFSGANDGLLQIVANTIIPGDGYELVKTVPGGKNSYEISIYTKMVQSHDQAEAVASMISRSFIYKYKSIDVKIFGNPLIQIGDIVKFNFYSGKVISSPDEYYVVTRISHEFSQGLSTTLTIRPLTQTSAVV